MRNAAYLSLGSNLGDRETNLRTAIAKLGALGEVTKVSSLYETEPVEFLDQPWFLNCAVELKTDLKANALLTAILGIEKSMGRVRLQPKGPRVIDLDILFFGDKVIHDAELTIPHAAMHERRFVLEPLAEIAPEILHPERKQNARELLNKLPPGPPIVRRYEGDPRHEK